MSTRTSDVVGSFVGQKDPLATRPLCGRFVATRCLCVLFFVEATSQSDELRIIVYLGHRRCLGHALVIIDDTR